MQPHLHLNYLLPCRLFRCFRVLFCPVTTWRCAGFVFVPCVCSLVFENSAHVAAEIRQEIAFIQSVEQTSPFSFCSLTLYIRVAFVIFIWERQKVFVFCFYLPLRCAQDADTQQLGHCFRKGSFERWRKGPAELYAMVQTGLLAGMLQAGLGWSLQPEEQRISSELMCISGFSRQIFLCKINNDIIV